MARYTRKELQKMSIKQLKMIENELSRKPSGNFRSDTSNIETITITVEEGNNFISFPYDLVDNTVQGLQEQNPHIPFQYIQGSGGNSLAGGLGLFDTDGDGFMESGNLTELLKQSGYFLNIYGNDDNITDTYELSLDIYPNIFDDPISYNLFSPPRFCGNNKIVSYDGPDGAHPLDVLDARGAFVERIIGNGMALFNNCLEDWINEYEANEPYDPMNDFGGASPYNSDVPIYNYNENSCWSGNLSSMEFGKGYWINIYCPAAQGEGSEHQYASKNIQLYYSAMGDLEPNQSTSFAVNFATFQWLRPQSPPPKTTSALSNDEVKRKIKRLDTDGKLTGDIKNIRLNVPK